MKRRDASQAIRKGKKIRFADRAQRVGNNAAGHENRGNDPRHKERQRSDAKEVQAKPAISLDAEVFGRDPKWNVRKHSVEENEETTF